MGSEPNRNPAVNRVLSWVNEVLSRTLESGEREIVRGDLEESHASGGQAVREVAGLVVRRQAALLREWRSWAGVLGLIIPLGLVLTLASRRTAYGNAIYIWLYANNWTWSYLSAGFREQLFGAGAGIVVSWIALAAWSWTGGLLIGYLSRRTIWLNAAVLCFALLVGAFVRPAPIFVESLFAPHVARVGPGPNAAVFVLAFYRVVFPVAVQCVFVLMPSMAGMRAGRRTVALSRSLRTLFWICAIVSMASLATQDSYWWQIRTWQLYPLRLPRLPSLEFAAIVGPAGYMVALVTFGWSRRRTMQTK